MQMNGRMQPPWEYLFPLSPVNFLKACKHLKEIFTSSTIMAPREQLRSLAHPLHFLRDVLGLLVELVLHPLGKLMVLGALSVKGALVGSSLRREQRRILSGSAGGDGDPSQQQGKVSWGWWKSSSVLHSISHGFVHPLDPSYLWGMISAPLISSAQATSPKSLGSTVIILLCRERYWGFFWCTGEMNRA